MDAMELVYACVFCSSADMEGERERDEDPEAVKEDGVDMGKPWLGGGRGFTGARERPLQEACDLRGKSQDVCSGTKEATEAARDYVIAAKKRWNRCQKYLCDSGSSVTQWNPDRVSNEMKYLEDALLERDQTNGGRSA